MQRESGTIHRSGAIGVTAVLDTPSGTATARSGTADPHTGQAATDNLSSTRRPLEPSRKSHIPLTC
ncbi:hypothetical protein GCM10010398_62770 [Streptomyces fimbriatus]